MHITLPPQRIGTYSPGGCARADYPELSDDQYVKAVCEKAVADGSPATRPR
jgi:hypothetical protein